jgi:hypothetical protein
MSVAVLLILGQHPLQVPVAVDQHVIEAFAPDGAHASFGVGVGPARMNCRHPQRHCNEGSTGVPMEHPRQPTVLLLLPSARHRASSRGAVRALADLTRGRGVPSGRLWPGLSQVPQIEGNPRVPVLTLHGLGDLFVPFSMEEIYASRVARHHESGLLVQRAIRTTQHCEFSPTEAGTAWNDLVHWIGTGQHPAGDAVSDPSAVARPDFGCRFSDPAAYAAGMGTRRLFSACPTT